jgi:hypothetical protein
MPGIFDPRVPRGAQHLMKAAATHPRLPTAVSALALLTIGVGVYMAMLRPPLLPEDLRALEVDIKSLPPSLLRWLSIVFATWGAFITAFGVLLLGIARTLSGARTYVLQWATALAVLVAFSRFLWSNIVLGSDFLGFIAPLCLFAFGVAILLVFGRSRDSTAPSSDASVVASAVMSKYPFHHESQVDIDADEATLFAHLDDHRRLSGHMEKPSLMMAGAVMRVEMDALQGQAVGSLIRVTGRVLGIHLEVEEVVTERMPPSGKTWETRGEPRLLVIGAYRMGFRISPYAGRSRLVVFIDYQLPPAGLPNALGRLFGRAYAEWCTKRMAGDAQAAELPERVGQS